MVVTTEERVSQKPISFKPSPAQSIAIDAMRRRLHLGKAGLMEEALAEFFKRRDEPWPYVDRRKP